MRQVLLVLLLSACHRPPVERCPGKPPRCARAFAVSGGETVPAQCLGDHWMCGLESELDEKTTAPRARVAGPAPPPAPPAAPWASPQPTQSVRRAADLGGRCAGAQPPCFKDLGAGSCGDIALGAVCQPKHRRWACDHGWLLESQCKSFGFNRF